jgi:hypothetical protein
MQNHSSPPETEEQRAPERKRQRCSLAAPGPSIARERDDIVGELWAQTQREEPQQVSLHYSIPVEMCFLFSDGTETSIADSATLSDHKSQRR